MEQSERLPDLWHRLEVVAARIREHTTVENLKTWLAAQADHRILGTPGDCTDCVLTIFITDDLRIHCAQAFAGLHVRVYPGAEGVVEILIFAGGGEQPGVEVDDPLLCDIADAYDQIVPLHPEAHEVRAALASLLAS